MSYIPQKIFIDKAFLSEVENLDSLASIPQNDRVNLDDYITQQLLSGAITGAGGGGASSASSVTFSPAGSITAVNIQAAIQQLDSTKQSILVSGTTIKTVNGTTLLGAGNLVIPTGIDPAIIAAKGDILIGTANDTPAVLSVGSDAQILTADSTAPGGVKWASPTATVIPDGTETVKGIVELATAAEVVTGTSTTTVVTPAGLTAAFIPKSVANTKGDILVATANDMVSVLAAGANGFKLITDSTTATGLKYTEDIDVIHVANAAARVALTGLVKNDIIIQDDTADSYVYDGTAQVKLGGSVADATETVKGIVELATQSETETGTSTTLVPTVKTVSDTYIAKSIANAKGDLIAATADNTQIALTVGLNAEVLSADSTTATGLKWVKAVTYRYTAALAFVADGADFKMDIPQATHLVGLYPIVVVQENVAGVFKEVSTVVETSATGDVTIKVTAPTFTGRVIIM